MNKEQKNHPRREERGGRRGRGGRPHRGGDRGSHRGNRGFDDRNRGGRYDRGRDRGKRDDRPKRREGGEETRRHSEPGVEMAGRSVDEILQDACRRFGVTRDQLKTQVVSEGSKGFLGLLGAKPAVVRVQLVPSAVPNYGETVLARILKEMGLPDKVRRKRDTDGNTILDIQGPSGAMLIGRHGQTLESLQYLVSKVLQRVTTDEKAKIIVDVESYRERQNDKLRDLARKAKETGEEVSLRPMNARDRRIVHMTLKDDTGVSTQSRGEGMSRRVVIIPKDRKEAPAPVESEEPSGEGEIAPPEEVPSGEGEIAPPEEAPSGEGEAAGEPKAEPGNEAPREPEIDDDIGNR